MPFAEYSGFEDCVNKNKDKKNPEAYCASIKRKVEGKTDILQAGEKEGFRAYSIEIKGEKQYFVEGYISTYDKDKYDDIVTKQGMMDVHDQADTLKADLEHEAYKPDGNGYSQVGSRDALIPVAKVVEKRMDDLGVWVRAKLNPHIDGFKKLWGSIKDGFIDAFSIAFLEPPAGDYEIRGDGARLLNKINLLNVALTGNPVNENCKITRVVAKSRDKTFEEENKMTDEEKVEKPTEAEKPEAVQTEEAPAEETPSSETAEAPAKEEAPATPSAELKAINDRLDAIENRLSVPKTEEKPEPKVDYKAVMARLDKIDAKLAEPVTKAQVTTKAEAVDPNDVSFMQFIQ